MKSNYKKLGKYIREVNVRDTDKKVTLLLGVSIEKIFKPSIANTIGTDMSTYKIVKRNQFAYGPVTSRNGDKISIALLEDYDEAIVSQAYTPFEITDTNELLPEYLMMWFRRPEFDRYARFMSHGSAREIFGWEEMCDTELPIPHPDKQREIVKEYNTIVNRIKLNEQLNQKLEETAKALYKQWFVDFEFPDENGKPYKSNGGEMEYCEELMKEIPHLWKVENLNNICELITKGTTPEEMYSEEKSGLVKYIKGESFTDNHGFEDEKLSYISLETHHSLKRSIIQENDLLLSIAGTLGKFALVNKRVLPSNINQAVAIIRLNNPKITSRFIFWLFIGGWHKLFYAENTQQAVQANLSLTTVGTLPILISDDRVLKIIYRMINPILDQIDNRLCEIQTLLKLQRILLQRLSTIN